MNPVQRNGNAGAVVNLTDNAYNQNHFDGRRQVVRHRPLEPTFAGSNPAAPAKTNHAAIARHTHMTRTKICGITRLKDALHASSEGVDALGFNFSRKSPRSITPSAAKKIIDELPPFVSKVGIFVEQSPAEIADICSYSKIAVAQLHSERYSAADARFLKDMVQVIRVFRPDGSFSPQSLTPFAEESGVRTFLFDAYKEGMEVEPVKKLKPQSQDRYFQLKALPFSGFLLEPQPRQCS